MFSHVLMVRVLEIFTLNRWQIAALEEKYEHIQMSCQWKESTLEWENLLHFTNDIYQYSNTLPKVFNYFFFFLHVQCSLPVIRSVYNKSTLCWTPETRSSRAGLWVYDLEPGEHRGFSGISLVCTHHCVVALCMSTLVHASLMPQVVLSFQIQ